jgi:hypothetical protein
VGLWHNSVAIVWKVETTWWPDPVMKTDQRQR